MALTKCHECEAEISTEAEFCPRCGAPSKKKKPEPKPAEKVAGFIVLGIIVTAVLSTCGSDKKAPTEPATKETKEVEKACDKADLKCLGEQGVFAASIYCPKHVERHAKYQAKWTDGVLEFKFTRFAWKDKSAGVITYFGDKVEFQNGFGAFAPMIYACDLAADNKTVLDVRVQEGRLPR